VLGADGVGGVDGAAAPRCHELEQPSLGRVVGVDGRVPVEVVGREVGHHGRAHRQLPDGLQLVAAQLDDQQRRPLALDNGLTERATQVAAHEGVLPVGARNGASDGRRGRLAVGAGDGEHGRTLERGSTKLDLVEDLDAPGERRGNRRVGARDARRQHNGGPAAERLLVEPATTDLHVLKTGVGQTRRHRVARRVVSDHDLAIALAQVARRSQARATAAHHGDTPCRRAEVECAHEVT
jgi:hypothetical protein